MVAVFAGWWVWNSFSYQRLIVSYRIWYKEEERRNCQPTLLNWRHIFPYYLNISSSLPPFLQLRNFLFEKKKYIKLSSSYCNAVVLSGGYSIRVEHFMWLKKWKRIIFKYFWINEAFKMDYYPSHHQQPFQKCFNAIVFVRICSRAGAV